LSPAEYKNLRLQFATSRSSHGGRRSLPYAFTEHGAIMAATVLNSERAIEMSIFVVRAFVRMREALAANQQIVAKLTELERRLENHDADIRELVVSCLSWKWRERSSVKITERTYEERTQALHC